MVGCYTSSAVFNMSKIQIWKRITTRIARSVDKSKLYLICQRYKFESESQQLRDNQKLCEAVFNMSKIQIWKRITTHKNSCPVKGRAVFNMSKIQIWKRITTCFFLCIEFDRLYLICQRYKFESESQQTGEVVRRQSRCI